MESKKCVCKDCGKIKNCELHSKYEKTECKNGEHPIDVCTMRENNELKNK